MEGDVLTVHGSTFSQELDGPRLESLLHRVRDLMLDGHWRGLAEIVAAVGGSEAGVSARLRQLRNEYRYRIDRERRESTARTSGAWVYRLVLDVNKQELFS